MPRKVKKSIDLRVETRSVSKPASKPVVTIKSRKPRKKMSLGKLAYKVARINCEKKESGTYGADLTHGQIFTDGSANVNSGHYLTASLSFNASNGTTDVTRIGDEVIVTGIYSQFQFSQQSNTTQKVKGKIYFFAPRLGSSNATVTVGNFLNPNGVIYNASGLQNQVYDYMSSRNMDYYKDFKVLRVKRFSVGPDLAGTTQKMLNTFKCGLKFKKPWKCRFNSAGQLVHGQIYMLVVFDCGNSGATAPSAGAQLQALPKTDVLSGVQWSYFTKTYFMDP